MKLLPLIALVISAGSILVSAYTYQKTTQVIDGLGSFAYYAHDPKLKISIEDAAIDYTRYSERVKGKVSIEVTNKDLPLDKFNVSVEVMIKDLGGNTVGKAVLRREIKAASTSIEFSDAYIVDKKDLREGAVYSFVVESYNWFPVAREYKPVN